MPLVRLFRWVWSFFKPTEPVSFSAARVSHAKHSDNHLKEPSPQTRIDSPADQGTFASTFSSEKVDTESKFGGMAGTVAARMLHQAIKPHVPQIHFPKRTPPPSLVGREEKGQKQPSFEAKHGLTEIHKSPPASRPPIGLTPRGTGIDESLLPRSFRRKPITQEEMDLINASQGGNAEVYTMALDANNILTRGSSSFRLNSARSVRSITPFGQQQQTERKSSLQLCWFFCQSATRRDGANVAQISRDLMDQCSTGDLSCYAGFEDRSSGLLAALLALFESCTEDYIVSTCVKLVDGFIYHNKKGKKRRCNVLNSLNTCLSLMKSVLLSSKSNRDMLTTETVLGLLQLVIVLGPKDRKFGARMRLCGFLRHCCASLTKQHYNDILTIPLLSILSVACQAGVKNIAAINRHQDVGQFVLRTLTGLGLEDPHLCKKALELLYFMAKSKQEKQKLLQRGIISTLLELFDTYYTAAFPLGTAGAENSSLGSASTIRADGSQATTPVVSRSQNVLSSNYSSKDLAQIPIMVLSCFRVLGKLKAARDMLLNGGGLSLFESVIKRSLSENMPSYKHTIVDGICALCLRCLPLVPFPLEKLDHPVVYPLPGTAAAAAKAKEQEANNQSDSEEELVLSDGEEAENQGDGETPGNSAVSLLSRLQSTQSLNGGLKSNFPANKQNEKMVQQCAAYFPEFELILDAGADADERPGRQNSAGARRERPLTRGGSLDRRTPPRASSAVKKHLISMPPSRSRRSSFDQLRVDGSSMIQREDSMSQLKLKKDFITHNKMTVGVPRRTREYRSMIFAPTNRGKLTAPLPSLKTAVKFTAKAYRAASQKTISVVPFVKLAYPDMHGAYPDLPMQNQREFRFALRHEVLRQIERHRRPETRERKVIFDLDELLARGVKPSSSARLKNTDEATVGQKDLDCDTLKFESRFECGNLRRAVQLGPYEYELYVSPDINQLSLHFQWFYFEVSNMESEIQYTFHLVNFVKGSSQFSEGMQPVVFSVREAMAGRPGWARSGQAVTYYRNRFARPTKASKVEGKGFYSLTFSLAFRHSYDVCYIAYHYPYTFSMLQAQISDWTKGLNRRAKDIYFHQTDLCRTIAGNAVPLLTITGDGTPEEFDRREFVILSSRVHPGETNASWMMHGVLRFLLSDSPFAKEARSAFIFKIIPILNPDGVVNGSHRCSLAGQDLNRQWQEPSQQLHPPVYYAKLLLQFLKTMGKDPLVFCDFHGHSKMKNVFMFGNDPKESWFSPDLRLPANADHLQFPQILDELAPAFSLTNCRFVVEKNKESTARVVAWRQYGVTRAYTMEASYCGFDDGMYKGFQVSTKELLEMGEKFCLGLIELKRRLDREISLTTESPQEESDSELEVDFMPHLHDKYDSD